MSNPGPPRQSAVLMELTEGIRFFTSAENRPFAHLPNKCVPLRSAAFRDWLFGEYQVEQDDVPGHQAYRSILDQLEARAVRDTHSTRIAVARRVGSRTQTVVPKSLLIDLADPAGNMVDITPEGWSVVPNSVPFESSSSAAPMPAPVHSQGDPLETLRACLNLSTRSDWLRCLTWLLAAFRPSGPYPVLILQGPSGSGKSLAARLLRTLVDPSSAPLAAPPTSVRELAGLARRHWVLAFDHVRSLGCNLTDAICRLTSGMGVTTHEQICARGAQPFEQSIGRPILVTATADWTCPPDLASRTLVVNLQPIPPDRHRNETDILNTFAVNFPAIFGALCTVLSAALGRAGQLTQPSSGSHCADALAWATAASAALRATPAELREACVPPPPRYPLVDALLAFLDLQPAWTGTATELQQQLRVALTPQRLSRQIAEHTRILSARHIHVNFRRVHGGARRIDLSRTPGDDKPASGDTDASTMDTAGYSGGDDHPATLSSPSGVALRAANR